MLEISDNHIKRLNDEDLRTLVVKLCEAELRSLGLPISAITAGGNQTAADGGIDVRVELQANSSSKLDFIKRHVTGFQVKCQDMPAGEIEDEMRPGGALRPAIKELIEKNGAYVIVSSQGSCADSALKRRHTAMRQAVESESQSQNLAVDFFDRVRLAAWVRNYSGVEMWLRERINDRLQGWQPFGKWTSDKSSLPYLHDSSGRLLAKTSGSSETMSAESGVDALRKQLMKAGSVVRLIGLSGTGKTRLVQALFEAEVGAIAPLDTSIAVYTDLGDGPEPNARDMLLRLGSQQRRAIVVVDNCNPATHRSLMGVVSQYDAYLSLITVEYDVADDEPEATEVFELVASSSEVLEGILERLTPHILIEDRRLIVAFSSGNARVALALARTIKAGQSLGTLNDTELFKRLFEQTKGDNQALLRAGEVCALVYSFEGEDIKSDASELRALASIAGGSPTELYRQISTLKQRDLMQSRSRWRAILPHALANRLAKMALQNIPASVILEAIVSHERLLRSFTRRLSFLHDCPEACAIAERWIDDENWLANPARLNELGVTLFFNLAPLVPEKVLDALERSLHEGSENEFAKNQWSSLSRWISLARKLAYEAKNFERGAGVILELAAREDEDRSDCKSAWTELFHCVLSGTLANPLQRGALLRSLWTGGNFHRKAFAVNGVAAMLEAHHFSSSHDFTFGARSHGYGWEAESIEDVVAWYDVAFSLVLEIALSGDEGRKVILPELAAKFRQLWSHRELQEKVVGLIKSLLVDDGWPAGWIALRTTMYFDAKEMPADQLRLLKELEALLKPKNLREQIFAYVLGSSYGALDLSDISDESDESGQVDAHERVNQKIVLLGKEASSDHDCLCVVVPKLMTSKSGRQHTFATGLGLACTKPREQWQFLCEEYAKLEPSHRSPSILIGFLDGLRTANPMLCNELLDSLVEDPSFGPIFTYLQGLPRDDIAGDRLLRAIGKGLIVARQVHVATRRLGMDGLSIEKYCTLVRRIAAMEDGVPVAIDSIAMEYFWCTSRKIPIPEALVQLGTELIGKFDFDVPDHNAMQHLKDVAKVCFAEKSSAPAVQEFSLRFLAAIEDYKKHTHHMGDLVCLLLKLHPQIALSTFLPTLSRRRSVFLYSRLDSIQKRVIHCANEEEILLWIEGDKATRLPLVASEIEILGRDANGEPQLSSLATKLLETASDKRQILEGFNHRFHPNSWMGSLEQALSAHIALAEKLTHDSSTEVAGWAREQLQLMNQRVQAERRNERASEERFE